MGLVQAPLPAHASLPQNIAACFSSILRPVFIRIIEYSWHAVSWSSSSSLQTSWYQCAFRIRQGSSGGGGFRQEKFGDQDHQTIKFGGDQTHQTRRFGGSDKKVRGIRVTRQNSSGDQTRKFGGTAIKFGGSDKTIRGSRQESSGECNECAQIVRGEIPI